MKTGNQIGVVHKRIIKHSFHKSTAIIALSTQLHYIVKLEIQQIQAKWL